MLFIDGKVANAGLDELQAGIKIGGRNINNLRYVDDNTLKKKKSLPLCDAYTSAVLVHILECECGLDTG